MCVGDWMSEKFEQWFQRELTQRGYDADVCTSYLISLLESEEDIQEWLQEMGNLEQEELQVFHHQIHQYYGSPEVIPELPREENDTQYQKLIEDMNDLLTDIQLTELKVAQEPMTEEPLTEELNLSDDETEALGDLLVEEDDSEEVIDYVTLANELEWYLSNAVPALVCSTESILESIFCTNGILTDAFYLLEYNHQLCCSAPQSRPCRHFIQTGKCLRSDCFFDHSFATKTCKFWLTTGCLSSECLFLHQLVLPDKTLGCCSAASQSSAVLPGLFDFPELMSSSTSIAKSQSEKKSYTTSVASSQSLSYKSALETMPPPSAPSETNVSPQRSSRREVGSISSTSIAQNQWVESGMELLFPLTFSVKS
jgi:hypothetical protein